MSGGNDGRLKIWQWKDDKLSLIQTLSVSGAVAENYSKYPNDATFSPDGKLLIAGGVMDSIRVYALKNNEFVLSQVLPEKYHVDNLLFHPGGNFMLSTSSENGKMWKLEKGKFTLHRAIEGVNYLSEIDFTPDGNFLAGARMEMIRIWAFRNGELRDVNELGT